VTGWVTYIVQPNDTLYSLGQRVGLDWVQIQQANCLPDTKIFVGQPLFLPFMPSPPNTPTAQPSPLPPAVATETSTPIPTLPPPGPGSPTLTVTPEAGAPGTTFTIQIEDFEPNEAIIIRIIYVPTFAIVYTDNFVVDEQGKLVVNYISPKDALVGDYTVDALGASSTASGEFKITSPP
jgi:hypothetical protein